jgi:hypothetical protein
LIFFPLSDKKKKINDKSKLSERIGRKGAGLRPFKVMIAGLPKNLSRVTHTWKGMSFLFPGAAINHQKE